MNLSRRTLVGLAGLLPLAALAQKAVPGYPSKPIRLVVGFAPGGGTDIIHRLLAPFLSQHLGQQVFIDNKPGAGGNIATEQVAKAAPDGYTLLSLTPGQMIANPLGMKLSFSPEKEIIPIGRVTASPMVVVVPASSPYKTMQEFLAAAKASGGKINYGSAGIGGVQHLGMETLKHAAGFAATHVPYRGSGPALIDLISGKIDVIMESSTAASTHIKSGALRPLAVTSPQPNPDLPGVPALQTVVPNVVVMSWTGIGAPAGMAPELVEYLNDVVRRSVTDPAFVSKAREAGGFPGWLDSTTFASAIQTERRETAELMRRANIRLDS
jgi:tripartite-type tricarboxylate transporter receptor subunit TctC